MSASASEALAKVLAQLKQLGLPVDDVSPTAAVLAAAAVAAAAYLANSQTIKLLHVPTVGGSGLPLLSYIGGQKYPNHAREMFQEGYEKHYGKIFKIPTPDRWILVATSPKLIEELHRLSDEVVSFDKAAQSLIEQKHTLGKESIEAVYLTQLVKNKLTKSMGILFPGVHDEVTVAFDEYMPAANDWTSVQVLGIAQKVVVRASNRIFVSLPLARNQEWLDLNVMFTIEASMAADKIRRYPTFLKFLVAKYWTNVPARIETAMRLFEPELTKRQALIAEYGHDYPDKPDDMLSWILDYNEGHPERSTLRRLAVAFLTLNFAAIHTSSNTFALILFTLASHPELLAPIREEIEAVVQAEGWTKVSMLKLYKLDSVMRESTRIHTFGGSSVLRQTTDTVRFSDGTTVPKGTMIVAPTSPVHLDDRAFANARDFQPFRFSDARKEGEGELNRQQFTATDLSYLTFGHGKHACPGRFFAGNEIKVMLAHLILNYDFKTADGQRPQSFEINGSVIPSPYAEVLFRKRAD